MPVISSSGQHEAENIPVNDVYIVVKNLDVSGLVTTIDALMKQGFTPAGGIVSMGNYFYQAMIREKSRRR